LSTGYDPTLSHRVALAGTDVYNSVCQSIADQRGIHLETAIAAEAYLGGIGSAERLMPQLFSK